MQVCNTGGCAAVGVGVCKCVILVAVLLLVLVCAMWLVAGVGLAEEWAYRVPSSTD